VASVRRRLLTIPLILVALAPALTACGAGAPSKAPEAVQAAQAARRTSAPSKVLVVIEENHSLAQMRAGMPFLARQSRKYGYATHWKALTHPSEPNYLAIVGGSTFGVTDDETPQVNASKVGAARSVFDQARSAGRTAGTYADSMPGRCYAYDAPARSVGRPLYAVRHNPWVYFARDRAACRAHDVNIAGFRRAARHNALPNVGLLIPNVLHDAHDGTLRAADTWLRKRLRPVLHSRDFKRGRLVVVVTADEDDRHAGNTVLTSVLTPRLHHKVVTTSLTHYSLTRFIAQVLHQNPLGNGRTAPDMPAAFGLPTG
jgi:predicted small lipoprotein YifL